MAKRMTMRNIKILSMPMAGAAPQMEGYVRGINFRLAAVGFDQMLENLKILSDAISYTVANIVASSLVQLMAQVQPRVPYYAGGELGPKSTGQLRESGAAVLLIGVGKGHKYGTIIARGKIDGSVEADMGKVTPTKFKGGKCQFIGGNITYSRTNSAGQDIALWAHESLYAYEERPGKPAARTPGTGPKYLEIPWLQNKDQIVKNIKESIRKLPKAVKRGSKIIRRRVNKYEVDMVRLEMERIAEEGYYGALSRTPYDVEGQSFY